jgi:hypothetical protein
MPDSPQIQDGRTVPIDVNYGKTVYVTIGEKRRLKAVFIAMGVEAVAYVVFMLKFAKTK